MAHLSENRLCLERFGKGVRSAATTCHILTAVIIGEARARISSFKRTLCAMWIRPIRYL